MTAKEFLGSIQKKVTSLFSGKLKVGTAIVIGLAIAVAFFNQVVVEEVAPYLSEQGHTFYGMVDPLKEHTIVVKKGVELGAVCNACHSTTDKKALFSCFECHEDNWSINVGIPNTVSEPMVQ